MAGAFLIVLFIAWLIIVITVTRLVVKRTKSSAAKVVGGVVVFSILLIAPLADEIIGKIQFEALCEKYAVAEIDERDAINRSVIYVPRKSDEYASHTAVKIRIDQKVYRDAETKKVVVKFHTLTATGGWLIRTLGISETDSPLLFRHFCSPRGMSGFKRKLNIKVIN